MKTLPHVTATAEQLPIVSQNRLGVEVIRGAAGSGKTSTALLRLKSLFFMFATRRQRQENPTPVRALILTFNRTLAGYIRNLAEYQISPDINVHLEIETFGRWAMSRLGYPQIKDGVARNKLSQLAGRIDELTHDYVLNEVEYLLGRFHPDDLDLYLSTERTGRGTTPRVGPKLRKRILKKVVKPYLKWMRSNDIWDWNTLSVRMQREVDPAPYDIIVVDESQDFSANQLRAIRNHLAEEHAVTFVIDTVQRIYARGFTWSEAGFTIRPERYHVLRKNHRNTRQIATFAAGILEGIGVDGDGSLPNLQTAQSNGPVPTVLRGLYQDQAKWVMNYIREKIDLDEYSVAFLKPQGGSWFSHISGQLSKNGVGFVTITREADWPMGDENVALCTFHSAKGLEFDYVFILGLNNETTPFGEEESDDRIFVLRRLLTVAIARARNAVVVGYKPGEESRLVSYFKSGTYSAEDV